MYKVGSAYSMTNMGGAEVTCPLCLGKGEIVGPKVVVKRSRKKVIKPKIVEKEKDNGENGKALDL
jgi:hypothetical protein